LFVSQPVSLNFVEPELRSGLWNLEVFAPFMTVPETAVDEDNRLVLRENQIRLAGKVFGMKPVAEAPLVQGFTDQHFGFGILAPDARHHPAAGGRINNIRHSVLPNPLILVFIPCISLIVKPSCYADVIGF